jgi:peptidoglycan/xylan/chitin deacetylase (PgdA/CDA1 family)
MRKGRLSVLVAPYWRRRFGAVLALMMSAGCGTGDIDRVEVARNDEFVVVRAGFSDTAPMLAQDYLDDAEKFWAIQEFNGTDRIVPGMEVVIPLKQVNPAGVSPNGYQTVPILCYHRFTERERSRQKLEITKREFYEQMQYLQDHGYRVIKLSELAQFFDQAADIPPKSVVITMDDGYKSIYDIAFPILKEFGYPATVFIYSDFVGAEAGLSWDQMQEMVASGLVDVQPHSKTHSNLTKLRAKDQADYARAVRNEIRDPATLISRKLGERAYSFTYPYGATNDAIVNELQRQGFQMGMTVKRGGNPAFASVYRLRRSQIYSTDDLSAFAKQLKVFEQVDLR